jgi:hypothetical protein
LCCVVLRCVVLCCVALCCVGGAKPYARKRGGSLAAAVGARTSIDDDWPSTVPNALCRGELALWRNCSNAASQPQLCGCTGVGVGVHGQTSVGRRRHAGCAGVGLFHQSSVTRGQSLCHVKWK